MIDLIKEILKKEQSSTVLFKRNIVKEYLQILVISFIYSREEFKHLVFYGGSCLRHCFGLGRLSEDLDFVDIEGKVSLDRIASLLEEFTRKVLGIKISTKNLNLNYLI